MRTILTRAGLTIAVLLTVCPPAHAWTDKTPAMPQAAGGYVQCRVTATSDTPIGILATIVSRDRRNVTEFGTGSRVRTDDGFAAEETAGSFDAEGTQYHCKFTITGARKKNVHASLTAFDSEGTAIATVNAR